MGIFSRRKRSRPHVAVPNFRGVPTAACVVCGSEWLNIPVMIDAETYEIVMYGLEAECWSCGTLLTAACPADMPEDVGFVLQEMEREREDEEPWWTEQK